MAAGPLQVGPALLAWAAVAFKLPAVYRNPRNPRLRAFWLGLAGVALTLTVLLPSVQLAIDELAGVPNLARLLGHSFGLAAGWSVLAFLLLLDDPASTARRKIHHYGWLLAGTLVLMAVLFELAPIDDETTEFMGRYADAPSMLEYWLVFLAYLGLVGANVVHRSWRYARLSDRVALRLGLRLTAAGALLGVGYVVHQGLYLAMRRLDLAYPLGSKVAVTQVLLAGAAGLILIGSTLPAWGPRVGIPALWQWINRYSTYHRLRPLWQALYQSSPEISLATRPPSALDRLTVRDLNFRLYRRVIEIRDGCLALRAYRDPLVADAARRLGQRAGLSGEELQVLIEASSLASAMRAKERGQPLAEAATFDVPGGADLDSEAAWLARVADCQAASPLVRAVLAQPARDDGKAAPGRVPSDHQ